MCAIKWTFSLVTLKINDSRTDQSVVHQLSTTIQIQCQYLHYFSPHFFFCLTKYQKTQFNKRKRLQKAFFVMKFMPATFVQNKNKQKNIRLQLSTSFQLDVTTVIQPFSSSISMGDSQKRKLQALILILIY